MPCRRVSYGTHILMGSGKEFDERGRARGGRFRLITSSMICYVFYIGLIGTLSRN